MSAVKLSWIALSAALLVTYVSGLNILLTNDDSWASANIRATYTALKSDGHDVLLVSPAVQQSSTGGTVHFPTTNITEPGGEFGTIPVGAPYFGHEADDPNIFYFNGTPSATALFAVDIIIPQFWNNKTIDLVVSGPNEGQNNGPFLFTLSGTIAAAYTLVERGLPAIALSATNGTHRSYTTNTGLPDDPANIVARLTANFVKAVAAGANGTDRLLPLGVGIDINFPTFGPGNNCTEPPFTLTRMTGGAVIDKVFINSTTGFPQFVDADAPGLNVAHSGLTILPGEKPISLQCKTAVTIFSVDYDAPTEVAEPVQMQILPIIGNTQI